MNSTEQVPQKSQSWQMFNAISTRYDFLNHFLSFGLDRKWRRKVAKSLPSQANLKVLDLATGTADTLLAFFKYNPHVASAVGIDLADKMLEIGRVKIKEKQLDNKIVLQQADANQLPFNAGSFDAASMVFGIRNVVDPMSVLKQMHRVLKSGGRVLILEFSLPANCFVRAVHLFYLRTVVPFAGWLFSGNYHAYRYLNLTIEEFPYGEKFCALMRQAGFQSIKTHSLFFGAATIYQGDK